MAQFVKKENLTISIGTYKDQAMENRAMKNQFFKLWGAGGIVGGKVFEQWKTKR